MKRVFLIGSPRSGTTILQRIIASDLRMTTFPETHFMYHLLGTNRLKRVLGIGNSDAAKSVLINLIKDTEVEYLIHDAQSHDWITVGKWLKYFQWVLDEWAIKRNAEGWLEKTPMHLHYLPQLKVNIKGAKYVHIIRSGVEVVASLIEITKVYPEKWGGAWSMEKAINRWEFDCKQHFKYLGLQDHIFILYSDLVDSSEAVIQKLNKELELKLDSLEISSEGNTKRLFGSSEPWKVDVGQPISKNIGKQKAEKLTLEELEYIQKRVKTIDLSLFSDI